MARRLADGIIAWLPVGRLSRLYPRLPPGVAAVRALAVNGFELEEYRQLAKLLGGTMLDDVEVYSKICTYQGEIWPDSHLYLPLRALLARAALLRDPTAYSNLGELAGENEFQKDPSLVQEALESGLPAIVARAMILQPRIVGEVYPGDVAWLPGFARWVQGRQLEAGRTRAEMKLTGYLGGGALGHLPLNYPDDYSSGVLEYLSRARPGMVSLHEEAEDSLFVGRTPSTRQRLISRWGFYPLTIRSEKTAFELSLRSIQPRLTAALQKTENLSRDWAKICPGPIVRSTVLRAREMLAQLQARPELQPPQLYREALLVVCGQPIDLSLLAYDEDDRIRDIMLAVAHPQLTADLVRDVDDDDWRHLTVNTACYSTWVRYDVPNFIKLVPKKHAGLWQIVLLAREGRLLQALQLPGFPESLQEQGLLAETGLMRGKHYNNSSALRRNIPWETSRLTCQGVSSARVTGALARKAKGAFLQCVRSTAILSLSEIQAVQDQLDIDPAVAFLLRQRALEAQKRYLELLQLFS